MKYQNIIIIFIIIPIIFSCSQNCSLDDIKISELPVAKIDSNYYYKIELSSNCDIVYRFFEKTAGTLPNDINVETTGEIIGTPRSTGTFEFTIKAKACFGSNGFEYTDCHEKTKTLILKVIE